MDRYVEIVDRFKVSRPDLAEAPMPSGVTGFWASSLDYPEWIWEGTDIPRQNAPGTYQSAGNDLRMIANMIGHIGEHELLRMLCAWPFVPREDLVYNAPDLRSSLDALTKGIDNTNPVLRLTTTEVRSGLDVEVEFIPELEEMRGFLEIVILVFLLRVVGAFQGFARGGARREDELKVEVAHAEAALVETMTDLLGIRFARASKATKIRVPQGILAATNPAHNVDRWDAIVASLATKPQLESRQIPLSSQLLRALVRNSLKTKGRVPHMPELAMARGMSLRSFAREMSAQRISMRDLINVERMDLSLEYLRDTQATVGTVATSLGYSDSSSFVRAFRKNFGVTPSEWRRSGKAG